MVIKNVKGCNDFLPSEQVVRDYINNTLKDTFLEYGYLPIETPILCYYDMLIDKYDKNNDLVKEIYRLTDQGNRELGLRYDLTVPFAKFIALNKNKISMPFKRYEISRVFRDGPVKLGRVREFTQCDVDVVGISGAMIEAECLCLYVSAFNKLGIDIKILYNSRNLMKGLIIESGIDNSYISSVITIVDKMNKVSLDEFKDMLLDINISIDKIDKLINLFNLSLSELSDKYGDSSINELVLGLEEVNNLDKYIKELGLESYCVFTPTLARGQDYYTGNVFEVYDADGRISSSIGGGGRYDNMITNYIDDGNIYPAVGISFGLTSIYEILKDSDISKVSIGDVYVIPMESEYYSLGFANKLRNNGIKVIVEMSKKKVKKCFEWANKNDIRYVIVIGENEINSSIINIKDMFKGENTEFNINDIDNIVKFIKKQK